MRRSRARTVVALLLAVSLASVGLATEAPLAVSPGTASGALIGDACPTFSWGIVEQASSYELVVYKVEDEREAAEPVLRQTFAGSASSWTPSLDRCLEQGGQYAWSVRAVSGDKASDWSPPSLFEVTGGPSEAELEAALEVVKGYLAVERDGTASVSTAEESTAVEEPRRPTTSGGPDTSGAIGRRPRGKNAKLI